MIRQPQALKTLRARWLRPPDRRILSRPLLWLILLALFAVLVGVTTIARIAFELTSPRVVRYAGDLSTRNRADYGSWPPGPFIPPINSEAIAAAELDSGASASSDLPAPSSVPIVVIGQPTATPVPTETPTPAASPSPTPTASPTLVPSPMPVVSSRRAPTSAPAPVRQVIPTPTLQVQPSLTPITNPNEPPAATLPPPTATPRLSTATPLPSPSAPVQTPSPSPTAPPTTPPATRTPATTPQPTSTPTPTSTPEPPLEVSFATTMQVVSEAQGRATVEVRLNRLASTTVTVAYATGGGTASPGVDYRPASGTLTFTPGTIARSFTIEILSDELNEPNETLEIRLSNPTNAEIVGSRVAILTITDSDAPPTGRFAGERRSVPENSGSAAITVELDRPAAIDVVVPYAVSGIAGPADHSLCAGALIIPAGATGARLRFTIVDDQIDEDDEYLVVILGTPSNAGLGSPSVSLFTVVDDDTAGITFSQTSFTLTEGASTTYTVVLESEPTAPVSIELTPDSQVAVTPDRLVFTPANWRVPQEVRLTALDDDVDEGDNDEETHPGAVMHRVISNDRFYARLTVPPVTVAIRDNDNAGVLVSPQRLALTEALGAAQAGSYTVRLASQPTAPVTVTIAFDQEVRLNDLPTGPVTLTFTPASWNTAQRVAVRAVDDAVDEDGDGNQRVHSSRISHSVSSADPFYNRDAPELRPTVEVEITDNDTAALLLPVGPLAVTEGQSLTYQVRLASEPVRPVTVTLTLSGPITVAPTSLEFDRTNRERTVTISAPDNAIDAPDATASITHTITTGDPAYATLPPGTVTVSVRDDDEAGVLVSPQRLALTEALGAAQAGSYTVRLASQPTAPVTVTIAFDQEVRLNDLPTGPVTLTFTPASWNTAQRVAVRAVDDAVDEDGDGNQRVHSSRISHSVSSADPFYNRDAPELRPTVEVEITDNDTAALLLPVGPLAVTEGQSLTYQVRLASEPVRPVTVTLTLSGPITVAPTSLEFDRTNRERTVTISAPDNAIDAPDATASITHTITTGDPAYATLPPGTVTVSVRDDDSPLEVAPFLLTTTEVGASFLQIALPCSWPGDRPLSVELWSPGIHFGSVGSADIVDPTMNDGPNNVLFELYDAGSRVTPDGTGINPEGRGLLADTTFNPVNTVEAWERLVVIPDPQPCGSYLLRTQTDGDDENYWAVRVGYDHDDSLLTRPISRSPSGDPIRIGTLLGGVELRPPMDAPLCMTMWVDVLPATSQLIFNNFDLDEEEPGSAGVRLRYYAPDAPYDPLGLTGGIEGIISENGVWVQQSIFSPQEGWWRMVVCSSGRNRYALEAVGDGFPLPLLYDAP
ncbi:MAG: Calx-beta domain-containing protein [Chloroflexaceae bacterium]